MTVSWPDSVDEILDGDHVTMLAYVTPAEGVVLGPVSNFGIRDRAAGTVTVNSSVGAWKKLERIRRNPNVALAYHTRNHALHDRPEYLLVQGRAELSEPIPDYPRTILANWERFEPWEGMHPLWHRWMRIYAIRVSIVVVVERIVVWPDLGCRGEYEVLGSPFPSSPPAAQKLPAKGTGSRINHRRAARRAAKLPDALLGWVGADGLPVVIPVRVTGTDDLGILLEAPEGLVPPGGRRAGLTAHRFHHGVIGQTQHIHTGWLEADPGSQLSYRPHTDASYGFPRSRLLYRLAAGGGTRWRRRVARRRGIPVP
jgi:hypothetical protein